METIINNNHSDNAMCLETIQVEQSAFVAEILRKNARVNLSMMAKQFGKSFKPYFWLRTDEAKRYLGALSELIKCNSADLVEVRRGRTPEKQGTWCNDYRIALRFAQWLSPAFSVMADDVLIRLMFGNAVFAEPINGVEPLVMHGELWCNYRDAIESFGVNRKNSASRRKKKLPQDFKTIYDRNFIARRYFIALCGYYGWKAQCGQLELPFAPSTDA